MLHLLPRIATTPLRDSRLLTFEESRHAREGRDDPDRERVTQSPNKTTPKSVVATKAPLGDAGASFCTCASKFGGQGYFAALGEGPGGPREIPTPATERGPKGGDSNKIEGRGVPDQRRPATSLTVLEAKRAHEKK